MPRTSSSTASSSRSPEPSDPSDARSTSPQITRRAPTWPGPEITVATATGSPRCTAAAISPSSGNVSLLMGSTKTSRIPPQVSPTANASSSLTPYVCSTGCPLAATSEESSYTAPSTHPPDTLPTTSPSGSTASAAPGSRGALRNVRTTVARPKVSPSSHHLVIVSKMSRTAHLKSSDRLQVTLLWRRLCHQAGEGLFDDLGDREFQDVVGARRLERGDERVDAPLGHHGLDRVHARVRQRGDRRRGHRGQHGDHLRQLVRRHVELEQHVSPRLNRPAQQQRDVLHRGALVRVRAADRAGDELGVAGQQGLKDAQPVLAERRPGLGEIDDRVDDVG